MTKITKQTFRICFITLTYRCLGFGAKFMNETLIISFSSNLLLEEKMKIKV